jgi:hypothetical protein
MNTSRTYRYAILIALLALVLHLYEGLVKSAMPSISWTLWPLAPYALCLGLWWRSKLGVPALAGVLVAFALDLYAHYTVFINPSSSTDALAMVAIPLYNTVLFCPLAMLIACVVVRKRKP